VTKRVRLGEITCPSGDLVVIDGGYLGIWSGDRSPADVDPALLGTDDPATEAEIRGAVDFEMVGPDVAAAAQFLAERQPGQTLYDIPASSVTAFQSAFETLCRDNGIDATLRPVDRVPHRERVRRCGSAGGLQIFGVPAVAVRGLPTDRPLWVEAEDAEYGPDVVGRWRSIAVRVTQAPVTSSTQIGQVVVDWARLAFADADALGSWQHETPIDGLADVAFWGRSQLEAAQAHDAPLVTTPGEAGVYGWTDLPVRVAIERAQAVMAWVEAEPERKLMVDFRPHSHHWQAMGQVRASETESGVVEVGGARILFAMTTWGDGFFPVHAERDADGNLVAIRVVLDPEP
jgi:hypothetical protein